MKDNLKHQQPQKAGAQARPQLAKTAARSRSQPQPHLQVKAAHAGSSALKRLTSCMSSLFIEILIVVFKKIYQQ
jgi:hypothetical protein